VEYSHLKSNRPLFSGHEASEQDLLEADPMEAMYALNIGDFITESFLSDELKNRIQNKAQNEPQQLKEQLDELIQLYSLDKTLNVLGFKANDGFVLFDSMTDMLKSLFEVDACHLFQASPQSAASERLSLTGSSVPLARENRWQLLVQLDKNNVLSKAFHSRQPLVYTALQVEPLWKPLAELEQGKTEALLVSPLVESVHTRGLLLFESYSPKVFSEEDVLFASVCGKLFMASLRLQSLVEKAQEEIQKTPLKVHVLLNLRAEITESIGDLGLMQQDFLEALALVIDARQQFFKGHSKRVSSIAQTLAEAMALNEKSVDLIRFSGLFGALGKLAVPKQLLTKKTALSSTEWETLENHPNVAVGMLLKLQFLSEVVPYVHHQRERWDGSGFPEGLAGRSIPLGSRILAVADAYHALTQQRPYREHTFSHTEALKVLQEETGIKWDPAVVSVLCNLPADSLL
jgi:HD-GYP domain-containing protein (c-di-GMP phosphodiesterase class II)